ncbi:unnamed protein product [Ceratitis capitata]|uniref:(Mediterranean fruit fly) hypothetical protein n=1 Tax=Ceratitis capitata TaxID=7213 RepID=A0A811USL7_CERCA|nr:unnamed protein product [Ceratitis capitata]
MWSPESEINSIAMATTMRHSQSSSSEPTELSGNAFQVLIPERSRERSLSELFNQSFNKSLLN